MIFNKFIENKKFGQDNKGIGWMPRHTQAMKDVLSCEKPRGGAKDLRSVDVRMGQPTHRNG